ncbi:MAG TPA: DUF29 family protein [Crenalkalicoccus sp.]|nr:DUF29 family protein [Crenalkalicoccus sp.]
MPDELYETDILAWSRAQAERLRRVAAGQRVNDVDWAHVIEEVEEVGRSELSAVLAYLDLAMLHALKVLAWPDHPAAQHWVSEIANFLLQAQARFQAGMQQHVDPAAIYARALRRLRRLPMQGPPALPLPEAVAFIAAELRDEEFGAADLLDRLRAAQAPLLSPATSPQP